MQSSGISLQPVSTCAIDLHLLETGRNGQVHTCVTMAGAKQNVQALYLNGPVRVHIHCYGRCPRLQTGLGQGTAAACVTNYTSGIVLLSIIGSCLSLLLQRACGVLSGKNCLHYQCGETSRSVALRVLGASLSAHAGRRSHIGKLCQLAPQKAGMKGQITLQCSHCSRTSPSAHQSLDNKVSLCSLCLGSCNTLCCCLMASITTSYKGRPMLVNLCYTCL